MLSPLNVWHQNLLIYSITLGQALCVSFTYSTYLFNPHQHSAGYTLSIPFYREENWSREKWNVLPNAARLLVDLILNLGF